MKSAPATKLEVVNGTMILFKEVQFGPPDAELAGSCQRKPDGFVDPRLWRRRHVLWSKYDCGVRMDTEAWFEVTPENVARYIAWRVREKRLVYDVCCGVGGNTVQFARTGSKVMAIDSSASRIDMTRNNAKVYGVESNISFVCADAYRYFEQLHQDNYGIATMFVSPPWGGKSCYAREKVSLNDLPLDITPLLQRALRCLGSFVVHLPRNINLSDIVKFTGTHGIKYCELETVVYPHPSPHVKCHILYVDANLTSFPSVLGIRRDIQRNTGYVPDIESRTWYILANSLLACGVLYRYLRNLLEAEAKSRVKFTPTTGKLATEILGRIKLL